MSPSTRSRARAEPPELGALLAGLGLRPLAHERTPRRGALSAELRDDWLELSQPATGGDGQGPALWRTLPGGNGPVRVFEIPLASPDTPAFERSPLARERLAALVEWARLTAEGASPAGWSVPGREEIESWVPAEDLVARRGAQHAAGCWLSVQGARPMLRLEFPLLERLPTELPDARRAWLEALFLDAQPRWRLVRLGPGTGGGWSASVDLTGVPAEEAPALAALAAATLRRTVEWLLPSVGLLLDTSVRSAALDQPPPGREPRPGHPRKD